MIAYFYFYVWPAWGERGVSRHCEIMEVIDDWTRLRNRSCGWFFVTEFPMHREVVGTERNRDVGDSRLAEIQYSYFTRKYSLSLAVGVPSRSWLDTGGEDRDQSQGG